MVIDTLDEPLFDFGDDKPIHLFGCGCQIVDATDSGPDGYPTTYWALCVQHADINLDSMADIDRRRNKR